MWDLIVSVPDHCLSFYFIYRSISPPTIFGAWCQDDYRPSPRAKLCLRSQKEPGNK